MLKRHFTKANPLSKILNKNTIRINYSRTRNMELIILTHNKQILTLKRNQAHCNCRNKNSCRLNDKCFTFQFIHLSDVTKNLDNEYMQYLGLAEKTFKEQFNRDAFCYKYLSNRKMFKRNRSFIDKCHHQNKFFLMDVKGNWD